MLTCGEETPNVFNGVRYLIENHRDLIDAEFALNEGAGGRFDPKTGVYASTPCRPARNSTRTSRSR